MYVTEVYEYVVVAGMGTSTAESIAAEATKLATDFFGDIAYDLRVEVTGRKGNWFIQARAQAQIKVEDKYDGR